MNILEYFDPEYAKTQGQMKTDLEHEIPGVQPGDAMRDTPWDRAQAFSTALQFVNQHPHIPLPLTKLIGRAYENSQVLLPFIGKGATNYGFADRMKDAIRDIKHNEEAYRYWEQLQEQHPGSLLSYEQMKDLGKKYEQGLLDF